MSSRTPVPPNEGLLWWRGPPGTPPSKRLITLVENNTKIQIGGESPTSLLKKIILDPKIYFVEEVEDEKSQSVQVRDTCFRLVAQQQQSQKSSSSPSSSTEDYQEIPLKAKSHTNRVDWVKFFVDFGAVARGGASISLSHQAKDEADEEFDDEEDEEDDEYHHNNNHRPSSHSPLQTSNNHNNETVNSGSSDTQSGVYYQHGVPQSSQPLRPAPPHTLQIPQIKIDEVPSSFHGDDDQQKAQEEQQKEQDLQNKTPESSEATFSAAMTVGGGAGGFGSGDYSNLGETFASLSNQIQQAQQELNKKRFEGGGDDQQKEQQEQQQQQQHHKLRSDFWPEVTAKSNPIYRQMRTKENSQLWNQLQSDILFADTLPSIENWNVERQPALEELVSRAALEALHQSKSLCNDPKIFGTPYAGGNVFDRRMLDDVSLNSVDTAYDLIGNARHSCDDPSKKPVKCVAVLCCFGDVEPEKKINIKNTAKKNNNYPPFVRAAGKAFFEVQEKSIRVAGGKSLTFEWDKSEIASVGSSGIAGCVENICLAEFRKWVPATETEFLNDVDEPAPLVLTINETVKKQQQRQQNQTQQQQQQQQQQYHSQEGGGEDRNQLHLVLLFKWPVRADTAARSLNDFHLASSSSSSSSSTSSSSSSALSIPQRSTKLAAGGLSLFAVDSQELRVDDAMRKWTMLDFCDSLKRSNVK